MRINPRSLASLFERVSAFLALTLLTVVLGYGAADPTEGVAPSAGPETRKEVPNAQQPDLPIQPNAMRVGAPTLGPADSEGATAELPGGNVPGSSSPISWMADLSQAGVSAVVTYGSPLLAYLLLRILTVQLVSRSMMKKAPKIVDTATSVGEQVLAAPRNETALHFMELSTANGIVSDEAHQRLVDRAVDTGPATWRGLWKTLLALPLVMLLLLATSLAVSTLHTAAPVLADVGLKGGILGLVALYVSFLLIMISWSRYRATGLVPLSLFATCVAVVAIPVIVAGILLKLPAYVFLLPVVLAIAALLHTYLRVREEARGDGNIKLLILRVFGSDRNTSFLFGPITEAWRFLGSFMTIVDPSYVRFQFSLTSRASRLRLRRFLLIYFVVVVPLAVLLGLIGDFLPVSVQIRTEIVSLCAWTILIPLAALPIVLTIPRRFSASADALRARLQEVRAHDGYWSGFFKGFPTYCYDNVWKVAVNELLAMSNVVLMDLRGFSPARAGCEYEVGLLIDRVSIGRVLFLVDAGPAKEAVHDLLRRRWASMSEDSPNRHGEATAKVYSPGDQDRRDIAHILALLAAASGTTAVGTSQVVGTKSDSVGAEKRASQPDAWTRVLTWLELPGQTWRRLKRMIVGLLEKLDVALTTPRYGGIAIVFLLAVVLTLLYSRVHSVLNPPLQDQGPSLSTSTGPMPSGNEVQADSKRKP